MLTIAGNPSQVGSLLPILGDEPTSVGLYKFTPDPGLPDGSVESPRPHQEDLLAVLGPPEQRQ
jgi:hypothetical protein